MCCATSFTLPVGVVLLLSVCALAGDDFYSMLGVSKDADNRAIRRAFKKIALRKHPDKNPDDKNAHAEFVKLNRAYEVLMDEDLRKKYDQFGEEGLSEDSHGGNQYQSWQFYRDNFGIYDDDPEIVTISRADFQQMVVESGETWFVNFYSTYCSHCHQLAPTWRKFAREMDGTIRIGAVNCAEDPMLCQSQNVMGYPSLVLYPERTFYMGQRELSSLVEFAMSKITLEVHHITATNFVALTQEWEQYAGFPWIVDFCDDHDNCLSQNNRRKLASMVEDLANVGTVNCFEGPNKDELCGQLGRTEGVVFYPAGKISKEEGKELFSLDPKEISKLILQYLPELEIIPAEQLREILKAEKRDTATLVRFVASTSVPDDGDDELRKLPSKVEDDVEVRVADCSSLDGICDSLLLKELPVWVMFKRSGGYEINYGKKNGIHDIASFAKDSSKSSMVTLVPDEYYKAVASEQNWIIDYFAPWCPPCMKLLHELRKVNSVVSDVRVGTVDCVQHTTICQQAGVNSYPTTIFYVSGRAHTNVGFHSVEEIAEFVEDVRNPSVKDLSQEEFDELIGKRSEGTLWIIDYYAPWCGPCQQLAPEFRKLARSVRQTSKSVFFGTVNCDALRSFCIGSAVNAYPTIRLFPADPKQRPFDYPSNWWRDYGSMQRWLSEFLPSKVRKVGNDFFSTVLDDPQPWLVDFFAPWCGHCVQFAPVFESIAEVLDGRVKLAKVNCDMWPGVCQSIGVRSYPSVRLYAGARDGNRQSVEGVIVHSQNAEAIVKIVEEELLKVKKLIKTEL